MHVRQCPETINTYSVGNHRCVTRILKWGEATFDIVIEMAVKRPTFLRKVKKKGANLEHFGTQMEGDFLPCPPGYAPGNQCQHRHTY